MLHIVRSMLDNNDFVHVFSFDFSKAFDTVRHASLTSKLAQLSIPDNIYNWVVDFLENHAHYTKYVTEQSPSSRQALSKARQLDPRPMPSLPPTCILLTIITGFLSLRMTPIWLCRASHLQALAAVWGRQLKAKQRQDEGDRFLGEREGGRTYSACPV